MNLAETYIREAKRHPILNRDEEAELVARYAETRDRKLSRRLVEGNLLLVVRIAHEYSRSRYNLLDLIQEGNLGLMKALERYDQAKGVRFATYATWWIRAFMLKFIVNNHRQLKIATTQHQRRIFFNLRRARNKLEAAGESVTSEKLAACLDVSEREIVAMQLACDEPVTSPDKIAGSATEQPAALVERQQLKALLDEKLRVFEETLTWRERQIFRWRLLSEDRPKLDVIGARFGVTKHRIMQIEASILERLKEYLRGEFDEVALAC